MFKQGRIRWLNEEEKSKKKLKRKLEEEEEEDSLLFTNALFKNNLKRAFFYSKFSEICIRPNALSIFFCTSSGLTLRTASNSDFKRS